MSNDETDSGEEEVDATLAILQAAYDAAADAALAARRLPDTDPGKIQIAAELSIAASELREYRRSRKGSWIRRLF